MNPINNIDKIRDETLDKFFRIQSGHGCGLASCLLCAGKEWEGICPFCSNWTGLQMSRQMTREIAREHLLHCFSFFSFKNPPLDSDAILDIRKRCEAIIEQLDH